MQEAERLQKLQSLAAQLEINVEYITKLRKLEAFEIIFLADDSGSMCTVLETGIQDPFGKAMTRWDELCQTLTIVVDLAAALDRNGVDVYFLNRAPMLGVTDSSQVRQAFQYPPQGYTPIVKTLNGIMSANRQKLSEKNCLLILATDGEPTDESGRVDKKSFDLWMKTKPKNLHVALVANTDNLNDVAFLEQYDSLPFVDVIDDYQTVKTAVLKQKGRFYKFTYSDYICKILLGTIDSEMDKLGESPACCTII